MEPSPNSAPCPQSLDVGAFPQRLLRSLRQRGNGLDLSEVQITIAVIGRQSVEKVIGDPSGLRLESAFTSDITLCP